MNKGRDVEYLKSVYIAHDITEEQAKVFYDVFGENYKVFPKKYDPSKCFELFEKYMPVYVVSFTYSFNGTEHHAEDRYANIEDAAKRFSHLYKSDEYKNVRIRNV